MPASIEPDTSNTPEGKLSGLFKRRSRRKDGATHSVAGSLSSNTSTGDVTNSGVGLRSSVEGAVDKLKGRAIDAIERRNSDASTNRKSVLERVRSKRKNRNRDGVSDTDFAGSQSRRQSVSFLDDSIVDGGPNRNASDDSLQLHKSVASSLLTEDSDPEAPPIRPSLTPRQSHKGYLTLSSPLIASETLKALPAAASVIAAPNKDNLASKTANTLEAVAPSSARRSPSPVNKLRDAFVPTRRSTTPKPGSDAESVKAPSTASSGLGGIFSGKKGVDSRRGSKASDDSTTVPSSDVPPVPLLHGKSKSFGAPRGNASLEHIVTTSAPATPPRLIDGTPETLVTPPTPTDPRHSTPDLALKAYTSTTSLPPATTAASSNPSIVVFPSGQMISHRRARSSTNPPSKLSNSITPLTPFIEETKTPGGTISAPNQTGGFFSSVFSAAQNAANQLSTTIANTSLPTGKNNNKGGNQAPNIDQEQSVVAGGEEVIVGNPQSDGVNEVGSESRPLAVETLGSGNLSLRHLGILETSEPNSMTTKGDNTDPASSIPHVEHASAKAEDNAAAEAVFAAYAAEKPAPITEISQRPGSITSVAELQTPPRTQSNGPDLSGIGRSGSIRSRISGGKRRRHRGSSATGNTIAAAIGASTAALANPTATVGTQGKRYAVQTAKRNRDFHQLFRSVPEDEYLIEDYSAALQRDILLQGRLYISEGHVCFSSNILGWVTNLVISFDEIVSVEKKNTAVIFPNAIVVQTLHARNVFASFVTRDSTYDLLVDIWGISHPNLKSSINGVTLDGPGTGDRTERADSINGTEDGSVDVSDDEIYDEDEEEEEGAGSFTDALDGSIAGSDAGLDLSMSRKASAAQAGPTLQNGNAKLVDPVVPVAASAATSTDFPGPPTHGATDCGDQATHYDTLLMDTIIPAPLGKVYSMTFGPTSGAWMRKWLVEDQKSRELQMEDDKKGMGEDKKTFGYSFIKPLNAPIGPKQTKCIINQTLEQFDLEKAVTVDCSTQNPDVPSGNAFTVKTKYCLMWAPGNATRLIMTCAIEWSAKSWIKGPIEKGTNDGQTQYAKDLVAALKAAITTKAPTKGAPRGKVRGRKKEKSSDSNGAGGHGSQGDSRIDRSTSQNEPNWGLLEPLRDVLGPMFDILKSLINTPATVIILGLLVSWMWFRQPNQSLGPGGMSASSRIAAYEEIWYQEESELWKWLEERVAMDRAAGLGDVRDKTWQNRQKLSSSQAKLMDESLSDLQMDEAIKVTQERLDTLRRAVEKKKDQKILKHDVSGTRLKTRPTEKNER